MFEAIKRAHREGMLRKYEWRIAFIITATLTIAALNPIEPLALAGLGVVRELISTSGLPLAPW